MGASDLGLAGAQSIRWQVKGSHHGLSPNKVVLGPDEAGMGLQIADAIWSGSGEPLREAMKSLHLERQAKKLFPLVVVAHNGTKAWVYGPSADAQTVAMPLGQATRVLQAALDERNGLAARQRLGALQKAASTGQRAGVVNQGLFAGHYLSTSAPLRKDWGDATSKARPLLPLRHEELVRALGFTIHQSGEALVLNDGKAARGVAVLLEAAEQFDAESQRFGISPVAYGLRTAARHEVPWLVVLRGSQIRLYPAKPGVGVGQKGQADTWFEMDLAVVDEEQAALLPLVFSAAALAANGSTQELLDGSSQFAVELGARLRDRVYDQVIPTLSQAVAAQLPALGIPVDAAGLDVAYKLTMRILFRLLFQAYAEDRGLLPYGRNAKFDAHSLKEWAQEYIDDPHQEFHAESVSIWADRATTWGVIDGGDPDWDVPAYNGGLFGSDETLHHEGYLLSRMKLSNATIGPVLAGLLVDSIEDGGGTGAVDFRSLSVREFGTIYEGLLESALSVAPSDLAVDKDLRYVPAKPGDEVVVASGEVYFHSSSGQRKSTGTYFTPHIVVEHLLTRSLDPVLHEHLARITTLLESGDRAKAAESFFDFRVADLSMGSAHFLTAAIDHIEARMRDFLTEHPIPAVQDELRMLQLAAEKALGDDASAVADIDAAALLRRQIARRCIYGLDINPMAVELARLAIWITTFVPGLPMSSLDHTLVCANSLTGVGTVDEAVQALDPSVKGGQISLFSEAIETELLKARELLLDAANASEATKADVTRSAELAREARTAAEPARLLFDAVVAGRLGLLTPTAYADAQALAEAAAAPAVAGPVTALQPAHFPFLFPEVFLRDNPGFDVILGNPPWEKLKVEEHAWWGVRFPGLRSLPQKDKNEAIAAYRSERPDLVGDFEAEVVAAKATAKLVNSGPFPGIGATDIDLMAAFSWRFVHEIRRNGAIGVVLPRTAFAGSALELWRKELLTSGDIVDLTMIVNNRNWLFPSVHPQYTVALLSYRLGRAGGNVVTLQGPYASREDFLAGTSADRTSSFPASEVLGWTAGAALPLLPDADSLPVFAQMRQHPDLCADAGGWRFRPLAELHTTKEKSFYDFDINSPGTNHDLPVWTGGTFALWDPDHGDPYAYANGRVIEEYLQKRRLKQVRLASSAFYGMPDSWVKDPSTLPMHHARIAFRDVARATDSRTMICALLPPGIGLVHVSPFLLRQQGAAGDEAYLVGLLSSLPFDWYSRRYVELHMTFALMGGFPVPRPEVDNVWKGRIVTVSGRLAAVDDRYSDWAAEVGVPVGSVKTPDEKDDLIAEIDALVALLYGLSADQLRHIFETFHVGWKYQDRLDAVMKHYTAWEGRA